MISPKQTRIILSLGLMGLVLMPLILMPASVDAHPPSDNPPPFTLKNPCALDPNNLVTNGSMSPSHDTQYGSLANNWDPFIFDGTPPQFQWVGNEQIDPNGSQQMVSTDTFDAGIFQTVRNLQPGVYYQFRLGYSLAAKSYSGPNERVTSIGRKVGVDPFGGTDPKSPNVIWGPDYFDGKAALNIPQMLLVFAARSSNATIFFRAIAREGGNGENRVWFDAACMQAINDWATATPPPATPTATLAATVTTVRPSAQPPTRPPATKIAQTQATNTAEVIIRAPYTPTPTDTPKPTNTPRYARPDATPEPGFQIDLGMGLIAGTGILLVIGAFVFIGGGFILFLWIRKR